MNDILHISEVGEWTPELAEKIADIKLDSTPECEMIFWSLPKGSIYKFKRDPSIQVKEGAD